MSTDEPNLDFITSQLAAGSKLWSSLHGAREL